MSGSLKLVEKVRLNPDTLKCNKPFDGQSACQLALFYQSACGHFNELGVYQIPYTMVWDRELCPKVVRGELEKKAAYLV